jgi:hypothetical protein
VTCLLRKSPLRATVRRQGNHNTNTGFVSASRGNRNCADRYDSSTTNAISLLRAAETQEPQIAGKLRIQPPSAGDQRHGCYGAAACHQLPGGLELRAQPAGRRAVRLRRSAEPRR